MAKGIRYVETNSAKVTGADFPGKTKNFTVIAFADKYAGANEQAKIDAALASGKGSKPSAPISVSFPANKPAKPTGLAASNTEPDRTKLDWDTAEKVQSWVVTQNGTGIRYVETNTKIVTNPNFPGTTAEFSVIAFYDKYTGETEQAQIDAAMNSGKGSDPADPVSVTFPTEKPGVATNLKANDIKYNSTKLTWTAPAKAQAYLVFKGATAVHYVEAVESTVTDESLAGTKTKFSVQAFNEKFTGDNEAAKIKAAQDSGRGGDKTPEIEVTFPLKPTAKPTGLKTNGEVFYNKVELAWDATPNAQSYVLSLDGTAKKYIETNTITLTDETFDGKTIKFSVVAYPKKYTGADEAAKIKAAQDSKEGSPKSDDLSVTFPKRPITPTGVASSNVTANSATVTWTAGSADGKAWVLHRNLDDPSDDPKKAIYMDYATDKTFTLNDGNFGGTLAGHRITYWVQEFNELGQGETDQEKADWLNNNAVGSEWSTKVTIDFPAAAKSKASKK